MATELRDIDATLLADEYDSTGRRTTTVDELIRETIEGDARLARLDADACNAAAVTWEEIARDLARQVINAETEIAELDEAAEDAIAWRDREIAKDGVSGSDNDHDRWKAAFVAEADASTSLSIRLQDEQQAHCDTYIEAVRLSEELAGWQNSSHAEYRRSTAARRLEAYQTVPDHRPAP